MPEFSEQGFFMLTPSVASDICNNVGASYNTQPLLSIDLASGLLIQNIMRKIGLIIFVAGLIMTALSGFNLITREHILHIGSVHITAQKMHTFDWSPLLGVSVMMVGAGLSLFAQKNTNHIHITK